jgi:hypothetical protein
MDVEHLTGGRRFWFAVLSSAALLLTMVGCGSGDDQGVGGNSTESDGAIDGEPAADAPDDVPSADVARDVRLEAAPADTGGDVTGDSSVVDVSVADVAADARLDSSTALGTDASEAGRDAVVDAAPDVTVDSGSTVTMDSGSTVAQDSGTTVTEDAAPDTGEVVADAEIDSPPVTEPPDASDGGGGGCSTAADCPAPTTDCRMATCTLGICGIADLGSGATCASNGGTRCNGNGTCVQCLGATDCPATNTTCKTNTCIGGVCGTTSAARTSTCSDHGGAVCDGNGDCVQCLAAGDCGPQTTACRTNTCAGSVCGTASTMIGSGCNDNGGTLCDGNGACVACLTASDCPAQPTACRTSTCVGHACGAMNAMLGLTCSDNGGVTCDGNGSCVANHCSDGLRDADETDVDCGGSCGATCTDSPTPQMCLVGGDCVSHVCSGAGTKVCQPPTCTDGVQNGSETDVDCGGAACDGTGHTCPDLAHCSVSADCVHGSCFGNGMSMCVSCADGVMDGNETDTDCGGMECDAQSRTCAAGAACIAAVDCTGSANACAGATYDTGATCPAGHCVGGTSVDCAASSMVCNDASGCVACNLATDCPATGSECTVATCTTNTCGTQFLDSTVTVTTGQTAGDCQKFVCNGAGGTQQVDNPSDPPISNTVCEIGVCSGSPLAPSFTFAATGTSCTADNQPPDQVCGDTTVPAIAGTCVQCNVDGDCAALSLTTCTANVCQ